MNKCCLCENKHKHPAGMEATQSGWVVANINTSSGRRRLVFCPEHDVDARWREIEKKVKL